jgi:hypothetical protein
MVKLSKCGCRCTRGAHVFKAQLLFRFPFKWFILLSECCQWFRFLRLFVHKPPVIIAIPQELLHLKKVIQASILGLLLPASISYSLNLVLIHRNALHSYDQSQIPYCFLMEFAHLWLQMQPQFQYSLHNPLNVANIFLFGITLY